jgi:hypothetical protein
MKNNKYHTVGAVPTSNGRMIETGEKSIPIAHIYMAAHLSDFLPSFPVVDLGV